MEENTEDTNFKKLQIEENNAIHINLECENSHIPFHLKSLSPTLSYLLWFTPKW